MLLKSYPDELGRNVSRAEIFRKTVRKQPGNKYQAKLFTGFHTHAHTPCEMRRTQANTHTKSHMA